MRLDTLDFPIKLSTMKFGKYALPRYYADYSSLSEVKGKKDKAISVTGYGGP
jgi:hypothetical protein